MLRTLRAQLLAILLPLGTLSLGLCALLAIDLVRVESELLRFRESALTAVRAELFARDLEVALADSFDRVIRPAGSPEPWNEAQRALRDSRARLGALLAREQAEQGFRTLAEELESLQAAVESQSERAIALAASGKAVEARRLLTHDLEALVRARVAERIDPLVRRELRNSERTSAQLAGANPAWVRKAIGPDPGAALVSALFESVLTARLGVYSFREYRLHDHAVHAGAPVDEAKREALRAAAAGALAQLRTLHGRSAQPAELAAALVDLEGAHARIQTEYDRIRSLVAAGRPAEASAALLPVRGLLGEYALADSGARIGHHAGEIASMAETIRVWAIGFGVLALSLLVGTFTAASRRFVRPVSRLARSMQKLRKGHDDWQLGLDLTRRDELGLVSQSFAKLASELDESSSKVRTLSFFDNVTGLPNRELFLERLEGGLLTAKLQGQTLGVLTIGLDSFKQVNEALGHRSGDELLRQIAERLSRCVRVRDMVGHPSTDGPTHEVSRLGGSHFTILLNRLSEPQDAAMVAERVLAELSRAFSVDGSDVNNRSNVGISVFPLDGATAESLLANSNVALQHARTNEANTYQFYSEAMNARASRKLRIGARLRGVLERGDLELHFQPFRNTETGEISGAEALLRWTDEELGPVPPSEFISQAEETGLIIPIGSWVLAEACAQAKRWQQAGYQPIRLAVNVSAHQLRRSAWPELVAETLRQNDLSPDMIEIEITESAILVDDAVTLASLAGVRELGIGISLDDFGTGYSSLSYLRRFPISRVKIDRSFVAEIANDSDGTELTAAILAMAQSLDLEVIAEGIETEVQARYLTERGCEELQGYLISRPIPAAEFERFLVREKDDELETAGDLDLDYQD